MPGFKDPSHTCWFSGAPEGDKKTAAALGIINVGFPVITDQLLSADEQIKDWFISEPDYDKIVQTAQEHCCDVWNW